jgi:hypothetical protein
MIQQSPAIYSTRIPYLLTRACKEEAANDSGRVG